MTITQTTPPRVHQIAWYILATTSVICATAVLILVPGVFGKIERILERLPPLGQVVAALSALSGLAAMLINRTKPVPEAVAVVAVIPPTNPPPDPNEPQLATQAELDSVDDDALTPTVGRRTKDGER